MSALLESLAATSVPTEANDNLSVADAVWIGVALLHQKYQHRAQFTIDEIVASVHAECLSTSPSVRQHVVQHCVANRKAQPNRSRMLYATREAEDSSDTHRRIFRDCDESRSHPDRKGAPTHPVWEKLPPKYRYLRDWYETERRKGSEPETDPLLALIGTGRGLWDGLSADAYVASLREGWDAQRP